MAATKQYVLLINNYEESIKSARFFQCQTYDQVLDKMIKYYAILKFNNSVPENSVYTLYEVFEYYIQVSTLSCNVFDYNDSTFQQISKYRLIEDLCSTYCRLADNTSKAMIQQKKKQDFNASNSASK